MTVELRVDMRDWDGSKAFDLYSSSMDSENIGCQLHLCNFTGGNAGDHFYLKKAKVFKLPSVTASSGDGRVD